MAHVKGPCVKDTDVSQHCFCIVRLRLFEEIGGVALIVLHAFP